MYREDILEQSLKFLSKVSDQYRGGIPLSCFQNIIQSKKTAKISNQELKILFVYASFESQSRIINEKHLELLTAAVSKGLGLEIAKQILFDIPNITDEGSPDISLRLKALCQSSHPSYILFLGQQLTEFLALEQLGAKLHQQFNFENVPALVTHSLIDVLADQSSKREFWTDLQVVKSKS